MIDGSSRPSRPPLSLRDEVINLHAQLSLCGRQHVRIMPSTCAPVGFILCDSKRRTMKTFLTWLCAGQKRKGKKKHTHGSAPVHQRHEKKKNRKLCTNPNQQSPWFKSRSCKSLGMISTVLPSGGLQLPDDVQSRLSDDIYIFPLLKR